MIRELTNGPTKAYLGDGLYAEIENQMLKLTAEDGVRVTETVYLERAVYVALRRYMLTHIDELL